jgi:hypothetical protein
MKPNFAGPIGRHIDAMKRDLGLPGDKPQIRDGSRPGLLYAYNRANRALVLFAPDGRPLGAIPCERLQEMGWKVLPSDLRESLPEYG